VGALAGRARPRRLRADLAMSPRELRDERRETEADPRWRRARARAGDDELAVRTALVVVVADDLAAALAWHPRWQPVPRVTAAARGRAALRLAALARRHGVALHRDPPLAATLAALPGRAAPDHLHPALARLIVAVSPQG
jgi:flagellar biosynthesis protein FlhB